MKVMKYHNKNIMALVRERCASYALHLLILFISIAGLYVYVLADGNEPVRLNDAVDDGQIRIVQSRSAGGYSRFMMEIENTSNQPLSIDPYGSAFDPPSGVNTQRVGIGLPIKMGDRKMDLRKSLSTDPSQEAPVGSQAAQDNADTVPDAAGAAAAGAAAATAAAGALLTGMSQGVRPREVVSEIAGLISGESDAVPTEAASELNYQIDMIKSYRDQDMTELDYQKQRLEAARAQGADDVVAKFLFVRG